MAGCSLHENLPTASMETPTLGAISVRVANTPTNELPQEYVICGEAQVTNLIAGQNFDAGEITISNSDTDLRITVETTDGWKIEKSHLHLALDPADFPTNNGGNPQIGHFDYIASYDPSTTFISYTFSLSEIPLNSGDILYVAFHAEVVNATGGRYQAETAWGEGPGFPGNSWAMYMSYALRACDDDPDDPGDEGVLRTQTQGGWGTVAQGNNPGAYRDAHFSDAFPNGVTIGTGGNSAHFSSTYAVQEFLPQGGTPGALMTNYLNPLSTNAGVFGGQVLALSLSVGFDLADEDFGESDTYLKDAIINDGASPFYGMTVQAVLNLANSFLGTGYAGGYSASELNEVVSKINESYVDGYKVTDFLALP